MPRLFFLGFAPSLLLISVLLASSLSAGAALAQSLPGIPADRTARGNAFVQAWSALRGELDSLAATGAHPGLADAWLFALPEAVLLDVTAIATEPRVLLAAAERLAALRSEAGKLELARLETRSSWPGMKAKLSEIRVRAGDAQAIAALRSDLESEAAVVQLEAAARLACAGMDVGLERLRRTLSSPRPGDVEQAARALGRCGVDDDVERLHRLVLAWPKEPFALAARGELLTRRAFALHHAELTRRDAAFVHDSAPGGTLDTWFAALGRLLEKGERRSDAVPAALLALRKDGPVFEPDAEVFMRRLTSLSETWAAIEDAVHATGPTPPWPSDFAAALLALSPVPANQETPVDRARRISAAVSLLQALAQGLGYAQRSPLSPSALSPGLERALDHSFATTARLVVKSVAVLAWQRPTVVRRLELSTFCAHVPGSRLAKVSLLLRGPSGEHRLTAWLDPDSLYFQPVALPPSPISRLEIEVDEVKGEGPACLAELRVF